MTDNSAKPGSGPAGLAGRTADAIDRFIDWFGRGTAWTCLLIVLIVATNVILRYLFRIGPVSLQELEWHLLSPIALIGMSYALRHDDHVRVDILYDDFSPKVREMIDLFVAIATVVISVILIKLSFNFVYQAYAIGEGSPDPGGLPHRFLLRAFIPLGFALLMLQALARGIRSVLVLKGAV
ncbi:MAG: TRAP transporter small permease subunit [Alphaproteobacteria bacterium]|nr:TRAP transporter small permease subunit [Alphaproteobacteria bacterium]